MFRQWILPIGSTFLIVGALTTLALWCTGVLQHVLPNPFLQ